MSNFYCHLFAVHCFRCNSRAPSARIATPQQERGGWPHLNASPPPCDRRPCPQPRHLAWLLLLPPPHYSGCSEPQRSATWPMINAAGCRAKSSPSGGTVIPVQGRAHRRRPGHGGPPCGGIAKGAAPSSGVGSGGRGAGFSAQPLPPSCLVEYTSVTAGRTPGVTD